MSCLVGKHVDIGGKTEETDIRSKVKTYCGGGKAEEMVDETLYEG